MRLELWVNGEFVRASKTSCSTKVITTESFHRFKKVCLPAIKVADILKREWFIAVVLTSRMNTGTWYNNPPKRVQGIASGTRQRANRGLPPKA